MPNQKSAWQSLKVYNTGAIFTKGEYHLFFRAVGKDGISKIGHAFSQDGENFKVDANPLIVPENKFDSKGVEDPRVTRVGKKYFLTLTAYDGRTARQAIYISNDLLEWKNPRLVFKDWHFQNNFSFLVPWDEAYDSSVEDENWSKAGAVFPEKINGKYWMLFGDRNIWLASSRDGDKWKAQNEPFLHPRDANYFDNIHIEMGPPPLKTKNGWLVLYHGIDQAVSYRLGCVLLDLKNPHKIISRSEKAIFEPTEEYEKKGLVDIAKDKKPEIIFCCGAVVNEDILRIYYGASDSVICTATASLSEVLKHVK